MPSLEGHHVVFDPDAYEQNISIGDALELLAAMERDTTGAAITGGWAAIEGLLKRKNERGAHLAADRLADIIACSFPVAEMLHLAQLHAKAGDDDLAADLGQAKRARDRLRILEAALRSGRTVHTTNHADAAALARVEGLLSEPSASFNRVRRYAAEALRRLYNQRNLIMHAGSLHSVALRATLRTAPALVGAGMDRIVHAQAMARRSGTQHPELALALAQQAADEIALLGTPDARPLTELLD